MRRGDDFNDFRLQMALEESKKGGAEGAGTAKQPKKKKEVYTHTTPIKHIHSDHP